MRAFTVLCSIIASGEAVTEFQHTALQYFITEFGIYSSEEMPEELPRGLRNFDSELFVWANMKQGEFIENAIEDIRSTHQVMLRIDPLDVLLKVQLDAMAAKVDDEEQRVVEFAKIYRRALRNLQDFN